MHDNYVISIIVLLNDRIASCCADNIIKIWDVKNYKCILILPKTDGILQSIHLLPDNRIISYSCIFKSKQAWETIISGRVRSRIEIFKIWNLDSGECDATFEYENCE